MTASREQISRLLAAWNSGDQTSLDELMPIVYAQLPRIAKRYMAGQAPGHTLQTTALIQEAYLRLMGQKEKQWQNRAHFFGVVAQAMRHILVDYARARRTAKRGGDAQRITLDDMATTDQAADMVALDDALNSLAEVAPRQSRVVEMRYFGG